MSDPRAESGPDPLAFAARVLEAEGALVESEAGHLNAILPAGLAARLVCPESAAFVPAQASSAPDAQVVGYGTPTLDRMLEIARGEGIVCSFRLESAPAGRRDLAQEAGRAYRFHTRARVRFGGTEAWQAEYLLVHFALAAKSEEVHESLLTVVINRTTLAPVRDMIPILVARLAAGNGLRAVPGEPDRRAGSLWSAARKEAVRAAAPPVQPFLAAMERRRDRDAERLHTYFESLAREAAGRKRRGRSPRSAGEAGDRLPAIAAEYERKIRDLTPRYTLRVTLRPVAAARVIVSVLRGEYLLQWRTSERSVPVIYNPLLQAFEELACERCGAGTRELHVETGDKDVSERTVLQMRCTDCG